MLDLWNLASLSICSQMVLFSYNKICYICFKCLLLINWLYIVYLLTLSNVCSAGAWWSTQNRYRSLVKSYSLLSTPLLMSIMLANSGCSAWACWPTHTEYSGVLKTYSAWVSPTHPVITAYSHEYMYACFVHHRWSILEYSLWVFWVFSVIKFGKYRFKAFISALNLP